jgi:uncharacterized protein (DUF1697 family)
MPIGIALIRGINVGGKNILPMATLRSLCEDAGLCDVRTYIQSGNIVFRADGAAMKKAAETIGDAVEGERGFRPSVVVRSLPEVTKAVAANPFASRAGLNKSRCLIMFLSDKPSPAAARAAMALGAGSDEVHVAGWEAFLNLPEGIADSTISLSDVERALGVSGTSRNLNTVEKLVEMAGEIEKG